MIWPARRRLSDPQHLEGAVVAERGADPAVQAPDRLQVVREHVGSGLDHGGDIALSALEIGGKHLDPATRNGVAHRADGGGPDARASVGQVVASDAGDDHEPQAHLLHGGGDPLGLVLVDGLGARRHHVAEAAAARAPVAQDQERGLARLPAFADVRAHRLFADRMQVEATHDRRELGVVGARRQPDLQPRRLARPARCGCVRSGTSARGRRWGGRGGACEGCGLGPASVVRV